MYGFQVKIIKSELLDKWERKQVRFPKSKKKRIRQKWAKKGYNFRGVFAKNFDTVVNNDTNVVLMSTAAYDAYMAKINSQRTIWVFMPNVARDAV